MKKLVLTLFILTPIFILAACNPSKTYDIVVTDYFTQDIASNIVGDDLSVYALQPHHMDYHTYEPTSQDLVTLKSSNVFIYISASHSPWIGTDETVTDLLGSGYYTSFEVLLNENHGHTHESDHHDHDEDDDHDHNHGFDFVSNPFYVKDIVEELIHFLSEIYPELASNFSERGSNYMNAIENAARSFKTERDASDALTIYFMGHMALTGFSEVFNLDVIHLDAHVSPNSDITSEAVTQFINALNENNVKILFVEEVYDESTLNFILERTENLEVKILHTFHKMNIEDSNDNLGYLDLISRNITYIKEVY